MTGRPSKTSKLFSSSVRVFGAVVAVVAGSSLAASGASSHASRGVVVSTESTTQYGTILVSGRALYTLQASSSACAASCIAVWPELTLPKGVTRATAGNGVSAAKLGVIHRAGGVLQVTYGGKPLYKFVGDTTATQVNGNLTDTWGKWSVVVTKAPASTGSTSSTTTTSPSGGGVSF